MLSKDAKDAAYSSVCLQFSSKYNYGSTVFFSFPRPGSCWPGVDPTYSINLFSSFLNLDGSDVVVTRNLRNGTLTGVFCFRLSSCRIHCAVRRYHTQGSDCKHAPVVPRYSSLLHPLHCEERFIL